MNQCTISDPATRVLKVELPEPYATLHHDDGYFTTNQREHDLRYSGPLRTKVFTRDQVNTLLADNSLAAEGKLKLDRYVWEEYTGHEHGWCEYRSDGTDDPRLPEHKQYQPDINWINPYQIRNFRALYSKPSKESI